MKSLSHLKMKSLLCICISIIFKKYFYMPSLSSRRLSTKKLPINGFLNLKLFLESFESCMFTHTHTNTTTYMLRLKK